MVLCLERGTEGHIISTSDNWREKILYKGRLQGHSIWEMTAVHRVKAFFTSIGTKKG